LRRSNDQEGRKRRFAEDRSVQVTSPALGVPRESGFIDNWLVTSFDGYGARMSLISWLF
jgi:hypothetical protein